MGVLLSFTLRAQVSSQDAVQVFNQIASRTHFPTYVSLQVINSNTMNAWASCHTVTITTSMLKFVKNRDELAMVIGHELSHVALQHCKSEPSRQQETNADALGALLMQKAGYNRCNGVEFFKRLQQRYGRGDRDGVHPKTSVRYTKLSKGCRR